MEKIQKKYLADTSSYLELWERSLLNLFVVLIFFFFFSLYSFDMRKLSMPLNIHKDHVYAGMYYYNNPR